MTRTLSFEFFGLKGHPDVHEACDMAQLGLSFLGAPSVWHGGEVLVFRTRKALALLIYLVVEGGSHPREKLMTVLWPESDYLRGQMSLRRALASLRKTLGDSASPQPGHILVEGDSLSFNFQADFEVDLERLNAAAELVHEQESVFPTRYAKNIHLLKSAAGLYRGDFLEGFTLKDAHLFDEWSGLQREVYHRKMDLICNRLSQWQFENGQIVNAIETCARWVRHNNLSETAYRRSMRLYFASGDRAASLSVYETCKRTLAAELGLEPAPETKALAEHIRAEVPPVLSRRTRDTVRSSAVSTILGRPFVGRAAEHSRLVSLYHTVQGAEPLVATLLGEAGIGKTRLASEFLRWAAAQGAQVLTSRAFETSGDLPFQPWTDILRSRPVQEALSRELLAEVWLGELSRLLPELMDRFPGVSPLRVGEAAAQARLFEAVACLGMALANRAPLVIFVDDAQWADNASLDLLRYLARRWSEGGAPILLLLSIRSETLNSRPALADWLADLNRDLKCARLELDALIYDHTRQWVQDLAGSQDDKEVVELFSQWLYAETEGQPFHIQAVLEALLEGGMLSSKLGERNAIDFQTAVRDREGLSGFMATDVREVIVARLAQLPPSEFALLAAAAVLGRRFNLDLLCRVADLGDDEGLSALDHLLAIRLVRERWDEEEQAVVRPYQFAHDKIRDVVYTEAGPARRGLLHRRALEALIADRAPAAELAHHALAASLKEEGFRHSIAAGDEAMRLVSTHEAITHYARALELVEQQLDDRVEPHKLRHLYLSYGRVLEISGQFTEALAIYEGLEALGDRYNDRAMTLAALMARVALHAIPTSVSDPIHAQALAERALALSRDLKDQAAEARLLWCLSHVYRVTHRNSQALDSAERSLALARSLNLKEQTALTLNDLGSHGYLMNGRVDQAKAALQEASTLWRELGDLPMLVDSLASMALVASMTGEYDEVLTYSDQAFQISQSTSNLWGQAFSRMQVGLAFWERGQPDQAIAAMEESIRLSEAAGFGVPQVLTRAFLAEIYGRLGAIERGLELAQLALTLTAVSIPHSDRLVRAVLAQLHILDGNLHEAAALVARAKDDYDQDVSPTIFSRVILADGELAYGLGQYERARRVSEKLLAYVKPTGMHAYLPAAHLLHGQALLGLGQREAAEECLLSARASAETLGSRQALLPILLALSRLERDRVKARTLRQLAHEIAAYMLNQISTPELRESFLQLAQVQEALKD